MKKYALIALALVSISGKLIAQSGEAVGWYGGLNFMPTLTSFEVRKFDNGVAKAQMSLGYGVGAELGYSFNEHIASQLEIIYSSLSQKYTDDAAVERTVNLTYLHFPLLFRYNTDITRPVNFNVVLGPQLGWNMGAKLDADDGATVDTVEAVIAVKPADLGIAYGAGFNFGLGPNANPKINLGFRGVYGILDISDKSQTTTTNQYYILDRSHVKTYAGVIGLTFMF